MEKTRFKPKELLPYGMLMTRLFKHVVSVSPELAFDHYLLHDRAMHPLAPHYERKTRANRGKKRPHDKSVSSDDEGSTKIRAFMAIVDDEPSVGKADARSGQWVDITIIKTCSKVTLDQLLSEQAPGNIIKALGGKGRRKEKISSKEVVFTKADESSFVLAPEITSDSESECDSQEPLPPLPKLIGATPFGTLENLISLSDLTLNMVDLTLDTHVLKTRPSVKVSPAYVIKKKTEKSPADPKPCPEKRVDSSTEQLLLTLMEEVKSLNRQIEIPSGTPPSSSQLICGSIAHEPSDCPKKHPNSKRPKIANRQSEPLKSGFTKGTNPCENVCAGLPQEESGPKVGFRDASLGDTKGYGSEIVMESPLPGLLILKEPFTTKMMKLSLLLPGEDVYVIDMSSFNKESNACFFANASSSINWLWHKRLSHLNFKNINNLAKHKIISGLPSLTFSKDKNCSACEKRKHHRASVKTKRSFFINKSLHLLHMDLFGPVRPQTISHNKYTLVIVDEYSRKMENLNEVRVKELRSDNKTEFRNHKLEEFYDKKGISHNFSSPCTPEQNGVAERRNITLIEAARTMLNSAKLPKQFWERLSTLLASLKIDQS
ncbi:retrovirus-related pol polyprotein from transposon TNT 1-94 [Tanacetum coccineum]